MTLLLDTHTFLWWVSNASLLSATARTALNDPQNRVLVSIVSLWEIAIKRSLGKLTTVVNFRTHVTDSGFELLLIEVDHVVAVEGLPYHHRDPFDRMLVAQAQVLGATLVTRDAKLHPYGVPILAA